MKKDSVSKAVLSNLGTSGGQLLIGLVTSIVVTRALGQEGKGFYNAALLLLSFYGPNFLLGYRSGVLYEGLQGKIKIKNFFFSGFLMVLLLASIGSFGLVYASTLGWLGNILRTISLDILLFVSLATIFSLLAGYCNSVLRIKGLFHLGNVCLLSGLLVTSLFQLGFYFFDMLNVYYAIIGITIGKGVELLVYIYHIIREIVPPLKVDFSKITYPFRYGLQAYAGNVIHQSNNQIDKVLLSFLLLPAGFGLYVVGVGLANLMNKLPSSYLNVFFNQITSLKSTTERVNLLLDIQRLSLLIGIFTFLFFVFFGKWLITLLYGEAFIKSYTVLCIYAIGLIFYTNAKVIIKFYGGVGRPLKNSLVYLVGMMAGIPFYFILIPRYDIFGAAWGSTLVYLFSYLFATYQVCREFNIPVLELVMIHKIKWKRIVKG